MADVFNFKIHIIASHPDLTRFSTQITIVEAVTAATLPQEQHAMFTGQIEEFHFVSTSPSDSSTTSSIDDNCSL